MIGADDDRGFASGAAYVFGSATPPDWQAPVVSSVSAIPNPVAVNTGVSLTATVDDTNTGGSIITSADFSVDGPSFASPSPMSAANGSFDEITEDVQAAIPAFTEAGVYQVCVRGTDAADDLAAPECLLLAVYNPDGGFVTGGGWIDSSWGVCPDFCKDATGKANFGFVSKYKKGATAPTGQTEFNFTAGDLNFHSGSYDWLVIAGAKAMYKGTGTINGTGTYTFQLNAIDGQVNGGGGVDKFRIKIKDAGDGVIYDNQQGADDNDDPTTALGGGNIVIHKVKE